MRHGHLVYGIRTLDIVEFAGRLLGTIVQCKAPLPPQLV